MEKGSGPASYEGSTNLGALYGWTLRSEKCLAEGYGRTSFNSDHPLTSVSVRRCKPSLLLVLIFSSNSLRHMCFLAFAELACTVRTWVSQRSSITVRIVRWGIRRSRSSRTRANIAKALHPHTRSASICRDPAIKIFHGLVPTTAFPATIPNWAHARAHQTDCVARTPDDVHDVERVACCAEDRHSVCAVSFRLAVFAGAEGEME